MGNNNGKLNFSSSSAIPSSRKRSFINRNLTFQGQGLISKIIGTGDNAKNSIVYLVIKYAFISGTIMSVFMIVYCVYFHSDINASSLLTNVLSIWDIVIPLITLALGYLFGYTNK